MKAADAKGRLKGKRPKLNARQERHLTDLHYSGDYSTAELASLFGVTRSTVYRALERTRQAARTPDSAGPRCNTASPQAVPPVRLASWSLRPLRTPLVVARILGRFGQSSVA